MESQAEKNKPIKIVGYDCVFKMYSAGAIFRVFHARPKKVRLFNEDLSDRRGSWVIM